MARPVLCVDFGSTFTKAALVDVDVAPGADPRSEPGCEPGALLATASARTTIGTDLMEALDDIVDGLGLSTAPGTDLEVRACSSAGGGLRIAVVGNEDLVTVEAGRRVALSSGGWVVAVSAGELERGGVGALQAARPDVVLLVGGTDGGNARVVRHNAGVLAADLGAVPVVVACNADVRAEVGRALQARGVPCTLADNVLPALGVVTPDSARTAIRDVFVRHVIGGKHLSRRADFRRIVQGPTPDLVLRGVGVLARIPLAGKGSGPLEPEPVRDVAVVDVGGATTDVHAVVRLPDDPQEVVETLRSGRTVEGDLGLRWNAPGVVEAAAAAGLLTPEQAADLGPRAARRQAEPGFVPDTPAERGTDERLAALAITLALRRHAGRDQVRFGPDGRVVERSGKDLRDVGVLLGSGGLLRHADPAVARGLLAETLQDKGNEGWLVPRDPALSVDRSYVLAAAGLLEPDHPQAAAALVSPLLP